MLLHLAGCFGSFDVQPPFGINIDLFDTPGTDDLYWLLAFDQGLVDKDIFSGPVTVEVMDEDAGP